MLSPMKTIWVSLEFKVLIYLLWKYHPTQHGILCIGLCLFPFMGWRHFAIQGCPCIVFSLWYYIMSQYKVISSNKRRIIQYFAIQGCPCIGFWWYYAVKSQYKQGRKFQYKVMIFCKSRLTFYWSIVLVKRSPSVLVV